MVGNGKLEMEEEKVTEIKNAPQPKTKKQVRSFLGLTGFYRKFIPNYADFFTFDGPDKKRDNQTVFTVQVRNKNHLKP